MIHLIIPSYRRPAQLYLLLESIKRFSDIFQVTILMKSHKDYDNGYSICGTDFDINICIENIFRDQMVYLIEGSSKNVAIACDDNILFRPVKVKQVRKGQVFSLRLGENVTIQNYATGEKLPYHEVIHEDDFLIWNPSGQGYYNWEYPFSLDFHIYDTQQLLDLISQIQFHNTNTLEGNLMRFKDRIVEMFCPRHSCSVNWPLNNISGLTSSQNISLEELHSKFMDGYKISLDHIVKEKIIGCHQLLNLQWVRR